MANPAFLAFFSCLPAGFPASLAISCGRLWLLPYIYCPFNIASIYSFSSSSCPHPLPRGFSFLVFLLACLILCNSLLLCLLQPWCFMWSKSVQSSLKEQYSHFVQLTKRQTLCQQDISGSAQMNSTAVFQNLENELVEATFSASSKGLQRPEKKESLKFFRVHVGHPWLGSCDAMGINTLLRSCCLLSTLSHNAPGVLPQNTPWWCLLTVTLQCDLLCISVWTSWAKTMNWAVTSHHVLQERHQENVNMTCFLWRHILQLQTYL